MGGRCRKLVLMCVMLACMMCMGMNVYAKDAEDKRVLFISSYSIGWNTVQLQIAGIQQGFETENVVLDYEFMDSMRVHDEKAVQLFYEGLKYRLEQTEGYDAVILGDDAALKFAMKYQQELFDGIPLIFEGVNSAELAEEAIQNPMIAGILEQLSVDKTIDLARRIFPNATKVVGIFDATLTGISEKESFYECAERYPDLEFSDIDASELTTAGLKRALKSLDQDTILIYVMMTEDAGGTQYTNQESVELIRTFSKVPAFRMVSGGIGMGLLGGNIVSMQKSGEIAAKTVLAALDGRMDMAETGIVQGSPNVYCIDEQVMKEFGLDMRVLPKETVIVNHTPTFAERNKEALYIGAVLFAAVAVLVVFMSVDNYKKRKLTKELEEARHIMEDASQHDFLTGLPNRSKFMADLATVIDEEKPCTVVMLDVDNFKSINDNFGHVVGDAALKEVADRLHRLRTPILTPYRFAGDEFIVLIRSNNRQIVEKSVVQCSEIFRKKFNLPGNSRNISGSIGVASYPEDTTDREQLIVYADAAMYEVKKNGKNAFIYYKDLNVLTGENTHTM